MSALLPLSCHPHIQRQKRKNDEHERARDEGLRLPLGEHLFFGWVMGHGTII